ncbi:MAG: hypothetical protein ACE14M_06025 [Terriglobales bacterium]
MLIETGTYFGDTITATQNHFSEIYSIELSPDLYKRAKKHFDGHLNVHLFQGDSGDVLKNILPAVKGRPLFWLDAHYSEGITARGAVDTPIMEELGTIFALCPNCVVLIDDARLFDGTNSYPKLSELQQYVADRGHDWVCEVRHDIIRVHRRNLLTQ